MCGLGVLILILFLFYSLIFPFTLSLTHSLPLSFPFSNFPSLHMERERESIFVYRRPMFTAHAKEREVYRLSTDLIIKINNRRIIEAK